MAESTSSPTESGTEHYRGIAVGLGITGVLVVLVPLLVYRAILNAPISHDGSDRSNFGAFVGGASGTLLTLATLIAVLFNLHLQAVELRETRALVKEQGRSARLQQFESTFFQLLRNFGETRDGISLRVTFAKGRQAIREIYQRVQSAYPSGNPPAANGPAVLEIIVQMHRSFYLEYEDEVGPYCRTLYHVFKFVENARDLTAAEKIGYANIARSQLSAFELALLFFNGLTPFGFEFKPLIEKYGILKHLNRTLLPDMRLAESPVLYKSSAFLSAGERAKLEADDAT